MSCFAENTPQRRALPAPCSRSLTILSGTGLLIGHNVRATAAVSSVDALSTTTTSHSICPAPFCWRRCSSVGANRLAPLNVGITTLIEGRAPKGPDAISLSPMRAVTSNPPTAMEDFRTIFPKCGLWTHDLAAGNAHETRYPGTGKPAIENANLCRARVRLACHAAIVEFVTLISLGKGTRHPKDDPSVDFEDIKINKYRFVAARPPLSEAMLL